jgi:superfamily II DNA/RNA helicase
MKMLGLLIDNAKMPWVIVVKSKKKADALAVFLMAKNISVEAVHGNHRQTQQEESVKKFNVGTVDILITTDMILKTLGLENIKGMLSYDLPDEVQEYYNRVALMKELGIAMMLVSPEDEVLLVDIETNMKKEIEEKFLEGFVATPKPKQRNKKDRSKKPRHRKNKSKREDDAN